MNSHFKQTQPFQKSYVRKVMRGLKNITIALAKMHDNPNDRDAAIEIRGIAEAISELAMIHGYHGVESIARKISTSFKCSRVKSDADFLSKIELAIKGIHHVVAMEDGIESKLIIEKITRAGKGSPSQISSLDELSEEQRRMVESESDTKFLFDIKESDFLSHLPSGLIPENLKALSERRQAVKIPS